MNMCMYEQHLLQAEMFPFNVTLRSPPHTRLRTYKLLGKIFVYGCEYWCLLLSDKCGMTRENKAGNHVKYSRLLRQ